MDYAQFLNTLSNPARQAFIHEGIGSFEVLITYTEKELLKLHGFGKASLPTVYSALKVNGLKLKSIPEK